MTGYRIPADDGWNQDLYDSIDISLAREQLGPMPPRIRERIRARIAKNLNAHSLAPGLDSADVA